MAKPKISPGKTKKKKKISQQDIHPHFESIKSLCNVAGLHDESLDPFAAFAGDIGGANELEDCLAQMDPSPPKKEEDSIPNIQPSDDSSRTLWRGPETYINRTAKTAPLVSSDLPHIQIELARHKHMGELSQHLLSSCHHLRMPSFERWVIDSKVEERTKRRFIMERQEQDIQSKELGFPGRGMDAKWKKRLKRKRMKEMTALEQHMTSSGKQTMIGYDVVVPSMADVDDDASKRLMEEINNGKEDSSTSDVKGKKKKRKRSGASQILDSKAICRELCRMACDAARHLQNLHQHLGVVRIEQYYGSGSGGGSKQKSGVGGRITIETNKGNDGHNGNNDNNDNNVYSMVYTRKGGKSEISAGGEKPKPFVVKINADHYHKLRDMFNSTHNTTPGTAYQQSMNVPSPSTYLGKSGINCRYSPATNIFHHLIFCMLLRYASLSGAQQLLDLRGGGMQGAIHSEVFDCLASLCDGDHGAPDSTGSVMECFASPLNVYSSRYCSMFHQDLDCHFGSCADFFAAPLGFFQERGGGANANKFPMLEANPPFSPGLMEEMVERMEGHLQFADSSTAKDGGGAGGAGRRLSFIIVVPTCDFGRRSKADASDGGNRGNLVQESAEKSFRLMLKSTYFSKHIVLLARQHGYIEGSQHLRPTRFKESQYDTSVIVLQSSAAKEEEKTSAKLTSKEFEEKVRKAFASRHQIELDERRKTKESSVDVNDEAEDYSSARKSDSMIANVSEKTLQPPVSQSPRKQDKSVKQKKKKKGVARPKYRSKQK